MAETFNPREYDRLLKKSTAEAEAYRLRTQTPAVAPAPDIGARQTAQKDRAALQAAEIEAASPKTLAPGSAEWEEAKVAAGNAARTKALAEGQSKAAADAVALEAYTSYGGKPGASDLARAAQKAPEPKVGASDIARAAQKTPPVAAEPTKVAESAKALAGAEPAKVGAVLDKLKEEEAKGGPDFWDVVQAAAAGWGGQVPLYVQKELKRKEAETQLQQAETIAQKQAEISAAERKQEQEDALARIRTEYAERAKLGLDKVAPIAGLSLQEFTGIK